MPTGPVDWGPGCVRLLQLGLGWARLAAPVVSLRTREAHRLVPNGPSPVSLTGGWIPRESCILRRPHIHISVPGSPLLSVHPTAFKAGGQVGTVAYL